MNTATPSPWVFIRFSYCEFHLTFNPIYIHFSRIHKILKEIHPIIIYEFYDTIQEESLLQKQPQILQRGYPIVIIQQDSSSKKKKKYIYVEKNLIPIFLFVLTFHGNFSYPSSENRYRRVKRTNPLRKRNMDFVRIFAA